LTVVHGRAECRESGRPVLRFHAGKYSEKRRIDAVRESPELRDTDAVRRFLKRLESRRIVLPDCLQFLEGGPSLRSFEPGIHELMDVRAPERGDLIKCSGAVSLE